MGLCTGASSGLGACGLRIGDSDLRRAKDFVFSYGELDTDDGFPDTSTVRGSTAGLFTLVGSALRTTLVAAFCVGLSERLRTAAVLYVFGVGGFSTRVDILVEGRGGEARIGGLEDRELDGDLRGECSEGSGDPDWTRDESSIGEAK